MVHFSDWIDNFSFKNEAKTVQTNYQSKPKWESMRNAKHYNILRESFTKLEEIGRTQLQNY